MRALVLPLLFCMMILACRKQTVAARYITLGYEQTRAADPWSTGSNDSATISHASDYLSGNHIYVADIWMDEDGDADPCEENTCKTGKVIYLSTLAADSMVSKCKQLGFR